MPRVQKLASQVVVGLLAAVCCAPVFAVDLAVESVEVTQWAQFGTTTLVAVGFDVEHHLASPLALGQTHASNQYDVMVAGQLTNVAWVDSGTYNDRLTDASGLFVEKSVAVTVTARSLFSADITGEGFTNGADISALLSNWSGTGMGDIDYDGAVDGVDLAFLLTEWTG